MPSCYAHLSLEITIPISRSILDTVLTDAKSLNGRVSALDKDKLDEYFQSIREIETGLTKDAQWADRPKPKTDRKKPLEGIEGEAEILLTYELIALALQTDQTSVVSYRQPVASVLKSMGMNYDPHALSHYSGSPARTDASRLRDKKAPRCWQNSFHYCCVVFYLFREEFKALE